MNNTDNIIQVALPVKLNSLFSYSVPAGMSAEDAIGKRVLVNFNGRILRGYAVSKGKFTDKFKIKPVEKIVDSRVMFTRQMVDFASWIADYYFAGIGEVLSLMVPKGLRPARDNIKETNIKSEKELTASQDKIFKNIVSDINNNINRFYLYGITGSGKTEIYIKIIQEVLKSGKSVIFLVPEIALSYQTLNRLTECFGSQCAVLHSGLKGSVKLREYLRLLDGKAKIAVGPRSALFAPLEDPGLIIIDEENESSFKSEESPRFHTRTAALYLVQKYNASIILGSATPSIESWYHSQKKYFKLYELKERFGGAILPDIQIIDTSQFTVKKNLTLPLITQINSRLQNKEQVILLQNRRGFANFIKCKSCGFVLECKRCNISLTYHKSKQKLLCHHCGLKIDVPAVCPECGNAQLSRIGAGTQRIEDEISMTFPHANVVRMDQDSLKNDMNYKEVLEQMNEGKIDILVGTQMIAKGLHFPNIKFVGIINADLILNIPDYKAAERTFSLITQVAGRAGRVGARGTVMIQTLNPDHYAIVNARDNNFEEFYAQEIEFRKILQMPPFVRMIRLVIRGNNEDKVVKDINILHSRITGLINNSINILGPAACLFAKINNNFRYQILLKSGRLNIIQDVIKTVVKDYKVSSKNYLEIDVDPQSLL